MRMTSDAIATTSQTKEDRRLHIDSINHVAFIIRDHVMCHSVYFADPDGNNIELTTYEV